MKPALGVTEPGAIAFAAATARRKLPGQIRQIELSLDSGMYKNAHTCGIPGSYEIGSWHAAALGAVAGDPDKGLLALEGITAADNAAAKKLVEAGVVRVSMTGAEGRIFIGLRLVTDQGECTVEIRDRHTNLCRIVLNGTELPVESARPEDAPPETDIHDYTLSQIVDYARTVPLRELSFIDEAFQMNLKLFELALSSDRTPVSRYLLAQNGSVRYSDDLLRTAELLCGAAIEGRVIGLDAPAMSITGSGAHGIICTMPLYAAYKVRGFSHEALLRATAISFLVTMYIKEYSGRLSAFCGCAIAAGTGSACALVFLLGGGAEEMRFAINSMASSITGMICDGGNAGCALKGVTAVDAMLTAAQLAMAGVTIPSSCGINGPDPETTMRYMGRIASPGMLETEKEILSILREKDEAQKSAR